MLDIMRRLTRAAVTATSVLGVSAALAAVAAGRWACAAALSPPRRAGARVPAAFTDARLVVHATAAGQVTLTRSLASLRPGVYALTGHRLHAVVGPVLDVDAGPDAVVRRLERVEHGVPSPGAQVRLTPQLHTGDPGGALGLPFSDTEIPAPDGALSAWYLPGARDTWVVALHGLGAHREQVLNVLPFLHRQRLPVLVPARRGDRDAGPRERARRLGGHEWRDADAALRHAVRHGARRVVLYGWSAGGAMALHTAARSPLRDRVAGLVLDSPVLEPAVTLGALARRRGVPRPLVPLAVRAARGGFGLDPAGPPPGDPGTSRGTPVPVLLVHGTDDSVAPVEAARALAAAHPGSVTLRAVPGAEHAATWNADPEGYEEALRRFLTPLM
jgi:pimeloyl-ACP methyl ester carboxylesterase